MNERVSEIELNQKIFGTVSWNLYLRLKRYAKETNRRIGEDIVAVAVEEYLNKMEGRS